MDFIITAFQKRYAYRHIYDVRKVIHSAFFVYQNKSYQLAYVQL